MADPDIERGLALHDHDHDRAGAEQILAVLADERIRLAESWSFEQNVRVRLAGDIEVLTAEITARSNQINAFLRHHQDFTFERLAVKMATAAGGRFHEPVVTATDGSRRVDPELKQLFASTYHLAETEMQDVRGKFFQKKYVERASVHVNRYHGLVALLFNYRARLTRQLAEAGGSRPSLQQVLAEAEATVETAAVRAAETESRLPIVMQPWTAEGWRGEAWQEGPAELGSARLYLGRLRPAPDPRLGSNAGFGTDRSVVHALPPGRNLHLSHEPAERDVVHGLVRSTLLRALLSVAAGNVRLTFFDPIGLGQSVSSLLDLAEYDPDLIGGKVWSATADLQQRLAEHTAHIELVIQKYLRSTYETIDDFNVEAGEVAEPYRYLVVFDFPSGFTEETTRELIRILQNGPRCGVRTILLTNRGLEVPYGVDLRGVGAAEPSLRTDGRAVFHRGDFDVEQVMEFETDKGVPPALIRGIVEHIGRRAIAQSESVVTFESVFSLFRDVALRGRTAGLPYEAATADPGDPASWWPGSSAESLIAPIGRTGAREIAGLTFDSGNHAGALLVGRPGSGKSTLLHTYLSGLTTLYGPEELELYLVDFKEGVEFQVYAREGLPHARCVAIESDREFGLSVLQSLGEELKRRGDLLRSSDGQHSGLSALRRATGEVIPRVLLVFDEFHVLFARNDKVGLAAAALLETLVRQGRGFGIHVLLGSQSLSGLDALGSHVPQLLPIRILLPATETDARRVLGEGNDAGQFLTRNGEGILNPSGGAVEANQRFRGAWQDEEERRQLVARMRQRADETGFTRRPVVFEGNAAVAIESLAPSVFRSSLTVGGRAPVRLRVGSPMTISGVADLELAREPGANVLVVARDVQLSQLTVAVASAAMSPATIDVVDFTTIDDGVEDALAPLLESGRIRVHRRRGFAAVLSELRASVRERVSADDTSAPPRLLFLHGVHRSRDLDVNGLDGDAELVDALEEVVRDGPEVGVHTWVWCETASGLGRRLPGSVVREFAWRIAGKQSPDDSLQLLGSEEAAQLRDRQVLLANDDRGITRRCTVFTVPGRAWLTSLSPR